MIEVNKKSKYSKLKAFICYLNFFIESTTKHLQLYWLFLDNNKFKSDNYRALRSNKSNDSSTFLYSSIDIGIYDL